LVLDSSQYPFLYFMQTGLQERGAFSYLLPSGT